MSKLDASVHSLPIGVPRGQMNVPRWHGEAQTQSGKDSLSNTNSSKIKNPISQSKHAIITSSGPLGITIDTTVSRHNGKVPVQLFPWNDFSEDRKGSADDCSLASQKEVLSSPPKLDLPKELSPSDRILLFGLSPSAVRRKCEKAFSRKAAANARLEVAVAPTPKIVITPAQDQDEFEISPEMAGIKKRLPIPSSVYSTSPEPGLSEKRRNEANSTIGYRNSIKCRHQTISNPSVQPSSEKSTPSAQVETSSFRSSDNRISSETILPTPRRSRGWWNLLISPVSARFAATDWLGHDNDDNMEDPILPRVADISGINEDKTEKYAEMDDMIEIVGPHSSSHVAAMDLSDEASHYYDPDEDFASPPGVERWRNEEVSTPFLGCFRSPEYPLGIVAADGYKEFSFSDATSVSEASDKSCLRKTLPDLPLRENRRDNRDENISKEQSSQPFPILGMASVGRSQIARSIDSRSNENAVVNRSWQWHDGASKSQTANSKGSESSECSNNDRPKWPRRIQSSKTGHRLPFDTGFDSTPKKIVTFRQKAEIIDDNPVKEEKPPNLQLEAHASCEKQPPALRSDSFDPNSTRLSTSMTTESQPEIVKSRKCLWISLSVGLLIVVVVTLVLALTVTSSYPDIPVQAQWLNLTGFPPMPTGVLTVARPNMVFQNSDCVSPSAMWSCSVPKEDQSAIFPNASNQPNFRIEIRFENGTIPNTTLLQTGRKRSLNGASNTVIASHLAKNHLLKVRDPLSSLLYTPSPPPPSQADQVFLGNTTDGIDAPYNGEVTPFSISILSPPSSTLNSTTPSEGQKVKRSIATPNIPPPSGFSTDPQATLYPLPAAQPMHLYNRGLANEHYGFYTYFTRSIFLSAAPISANISAASVTTTSNGSLAGPAALNANGGAPHAQANVICLWPQTRFRVQIWTRAGFVTNLPAASASLTSTVSSAAPTPMPSSSSLPEHRLARSPSTAPTATPEPSSSASGSSSSAFDVTPPGSFPYPITVTLDRHGGDPAQKGVVCYGLDGDGNVVDSQRRVITEDRAVGGTLVDPAAEAFQGVVGPDGGVDGGTGGCGCEWRNWT